MKRILNILFAFTAAVAVSCSKHNAVGLGPGSSYIFFEPDMLDITETKADLITELPKTDGTAFGVLGFYSNNNPIFTGYTNNIAKVYRNSGVYKYDNLSPWVGDQHTFYAFYPYSDLLDNVKLGDGNITYISYTQPTALADMKDILGTRITVSNPVNSVQLHFQHLLWAFKINVKNSQTNEVNNDGDTIEKPYLKVTEVTFKLQGFPSSVNLNLDENFNVTTNTFKDLSYTIYSNTTGDQIDYGKSKSYGPLLFVPVTGLKYQVTVKYVTQAGASGTYTYPSSGYKTVSSKFQYGKAYELTIEKKDDMFFVGIEPGEWTQSEFEHTFE